MGVLRLSVMIATNMNASNVIESSARSALRVAIISQSVHFAINAAIVRHAMMMQQVIFSLAVNAISNVVMIADSKGVVRDNRIAEVVSNESPPY